MVQHRLRFIGGSDSNSGTKESPYATLAKAVEQAEDGATIYVMSDLTVNSLARITDKHLTIASVEGQKYTLLRGTVQGSDNNQSHYNSAMIEVTTNGSEDSENASSVTLKNISLTDNGCHDGTYFAQTNTTIENNNQGNLAFVQDAMVTAHGKSNRAVYIVLDSGAELKDFGGMSALYGTMNAHITMKNESKIYDQTVSDRLKSDSKPTNETGPAGAIWLQGAEFNMESGAVIQNIVGRAIYADSGKVNIGGKIFNIKSDSDMWQGTSGFVTHVRNGATCTINQGAIISNNFENSADASGTVFDIMQENSNLEMKNGATIGPWKGNGTVFLIRGAENQYQCRLTIDGEITNVNTNGNHIVQTVQSVVKIGENANIHDNRVAYGTLYIQGGNKVEIRGKICNNYSTDRGGAIAITNHGDSWVDMYDTAMISGNYSRETGGGILVSDGIFTMHGGTISDNYASLEGGGVFVREGGSFIMEGGIISNNYTVTVGGGIAFQSGQDGGRVEIKNGSIEENYMSSELAIDENTGTCTVSDAGISNDIGITSKGSKSNMATHMTLFDASSIENSHIYLQKYNFSIERPAKDVKFGNAAADCETAVTNALKSQNLTEVVGSMWYQMDKDTLPLTVYDLTENGEYDETKDLYAAVVDTKADGTPVENASVSLYAVDVSEADGSFEMKLPGGATDGTAVVFLQEGDQPAKVVTLKPVDLTAYMGGDQGYDAVVDGNGQIVESTNSLPHPLFTVTGVEDAEGMVFSESGTNKKWTLVKDGTGYYHFLEGNGQDRVRVTYTNDTTGETTLSDSFKLEDVHELFNTYTVSLYTGSVDMSKVKASLNGQDYTVALGSGTLTVRAVQNSDPTTPILTTTPASSVTTGSATAVVTAGTTYTLNGLDGVTIPIDAAPSLLFDDIIASDGQGEARKEALKAAVDKTLGGAGNDRNYEYKYLDLVDANNGNAWIKASNNVTIYWGYPQGTDENTTFKLVHFKDLHRDTSGGAESGIDPSDITTAKTEIIDVKTTDQGITFEVTPGNFSPYVLVWEDNTTPGPDPDPTPTPDPEEPELERGDHYAYIFGYEDNTIRPDNDITRAEVATIFYRLLTDASRDEYRTTDNDFTDVSADAWYNETVSTLANAGVLAGYEDGSFRPNAPITRAEYAAIATRFDDLAAGTSSFTDISGHWAEAAINAAYSAGWVGGYEDGTFRPDQNITRAEAMALINRVLERAVDSDGMLDDMQRWVDCHPDAWYYADVQEATNSHDYEREEGEKYETWTELLPNKVF